ncbi:MAG: YbaB/EbfC family nucleoid-associated protein [Planctomycetota bacterium]
MPGGGQFGDMGSLLKQAQMMQKKMQDAERALGDRVVEGSAGGVVKVFVSGALEVKGVKIAKEAVDPDDVEGLEALVEGAIRQALLAAKQLKETEMGKITQGLSLPGLGF